MRGWSAAPVQMEACDWGNTWHPSLQIPETKVCDWGNTWHASAQVCKYLTLKFLIEEIPETQVHECANNWVSLQIPDTKVFDWRNRNLQNMYLTRNCSIEEIPDTCKCASEQNGSQVPRHSCEVNQVSLGALKGKHWKLVSNGLFDMCRWTVIWQGLGKFMINLPVFT